MNLQTGRFGTLTVQESEIITFPSGLLGFVEATRFCLVDPGDDTLILWLQSLDRPELAFAVLEPKIFKPDYSVRLSAVELRDLKLETVQQSAVYVILTLPSDLSQMTANLKAPIVINLQAQVARQVVLQENEYSLKHPMFKELRMHLLTIAAQKRASESQQVERSSATLAVGSLPPSTTVRSLSL